MLKKTITYTDYNGAERTETFWFNLSKAELMELQFSVNGDFGKYIESIQASQDNRKIIELFKEIILKSYGEKSADGKRFIKSKELAEEFSQTEAYSELFMQLAQNENEATAFISGIVPKEVQAAIANSENNVTSLPTGNN